jgi:glycosyltransferase involved in cell wall biosynthesis
MIDNLDDKKKIKILAYVHGYLPNHIAGSEIMLHQIFLNLMDKGFEVRVLTGDPGAKSYDGIEIESIHSKKANSWFSWADIVFTHHYFAKNAISLARRFYKPTVLLIHNDPRTKMNKLASFPAIDLVVSNSVWVSKLIYRAKQSMVLNPPCDPSLYSVKNTGSAISLINMNEDKGGKIFWDLARLLPDHEFIGLKGSYGKQIEYKEKLPNVTILEKTLNIKDVYAKTKIIIMPSSHESWGRVPLEAGASGIPTIASKTEGLQESIGSSGIFADLDSVADWVEKIKMLDDQETYRKYSKLAKDRSFSAFEEFEKQMLDFESRLIKLARKK